jgi:hypothetical protein
MPAVWANRSKRREHVDGVRLWETLHLPPANWKQIAQPWNHPRSVRSSFWYYTASPSQRPTDRLTLTVLRTTRYTNTRVGRMLRKFRSLESVQGRDIVTGLLWLRLRTWKFLCKVFPCTPIEGFFLAARPRLCSECNNISLTWINTKRCLCCTAATCFGMQMTYCQVYLCKIITQMLQKYITIVTYDTLYMNTKHWTTLLGAFAKKNRKATISFVMSVCPSVHTEQLSSQHREFSWNFIFEYFMKICRQNSKFF